MQLYWSILKTLGGREMIICCVIIPKEMLEMTYVIIQRSKNSDLLNIKLGTQGIIAYIIISI